MYFAIKGLLAHKLTDERGQATIEAAFALPVLMILVLLLLQPSIVLYDRIVMQGAAAEGCRLLATSSDVGGTCEDYIRRRLSAVPELDIFHVHSSGCTWNIQFTGNESGQSTSVSISTKLRPLPLLDFGVGLLGMTDSNGYITVSAAADMETQPEWASGSPQGISPQDWIRSWV